MTRDSGVTKLLGADGADGVGLGTARAGPPASPSQPKPALNSAGVSVTVAVLEMIDSTRVDSDMMELSQARCGQITAAGSADQHSVNHWPGPGQELKCQTRSSVPVTEPIELSQVTSYCWSVTVRVTAGY